MDTRSRHLLLELWGCDAARLDDLEGLRALMIQAAVAAGATVVREAFHAFSPHGVTGVVVVEESHLAVHTWPEHAYAAVDFFTCGQADPRAAVAVLQEGLGATEAEQCVVRRGAGPLRLE